MQVTLVLTWQESNFCINFYYAAIFWKYKYYAHEYSVSSLIRTPLFMVDVGSVQINEFVQTSEIIKNFSQHHSYHDGASFKTGNKHGFLTLLSKPNIQLALATHQVSITLFSSCIFGHFFENLSSLCNYSRTSTLVVLRTGCICSLWAAFSSIISIFSVISIVLMMHHFARFCNCYDPCGFCKYGFGFWILHSDHWGVR